jgi:hypothetical protein
MAVSSHAQHEIEAVRLVYLGLYWLVSAYFLSQNNIHSTS